jgi:hypothetical protein
MREEAEKCACGAVNAFNNYLGQMRLDTRSTPEYKYATFEEWWKQSTQVDVYTAFNAARELKEKKYDTNIF